MFVGIKCFSSQTVFYRWGSPGGAVSKGGAGKMKVAVQLVRRGATVLGEPCPKCGGLQVRFHGKVYCTSHEDLSRLLTAETLSVENVTSGMREVLLSKLAEVTAALEIEKDPAKQEEFVGLMTKCFDLLQRTSQKPQRP